VLAAGGVMAEETQWVRVTVLLETGPEFAHRAEETLVPGGVYSQAEVNRRGQQAIDQEILERVRRVSDHMRSAEESMRLATLLARQYYLPLKVGHKAVLPAVDLNPRIGVVFTPIRFSGDRAVCKVQFLEPEGPPGTTEFSGTEISLRLHEADLRDVLGVFSKITPYTIEAGPAVTGTVTVDLRQIPWDQALDLVLRSNGLGWSKKGDILEVAPLEEMSRHKKVRTEATINLPRKGWGSATIASQGDSGNPTVVLLVESVAGPPELVAERNGLVHPIEVQLVAPTDQDLEDSVGELAVFRGLLTTEGRLSNPEILAAPSSSYASALEEAVKSWRFRSVLSEEGRKQDAVVGYGVRFGPQRVVAAIGNVEHIDVRVEVAPAQPDRTGVYVLTAVISDLNTGRVIGEPHVTFQAGSEASMRTGFVAPSGSPTEFDMKVLVDGDGKRVSWSWTLTSDGKVVSSQSLKVKL
jgi:hypothetical protein